MKNLFYLFSFFIIKPRNLTTKIKLHSTLAKEKGIETKKLNYEENT